jgi:predicted TIM-barrel fold metal-dependent hydrolase
MAALISTPQEDEVLEPSDRTRERYDLISADSHMNEPRDLWTSRLPSKYHDRCLRVERFEQGDAWVTESLPNPWPFGRTTFGGRGTFADSIGSWMRWEDVPLSGYVPAHRLVAQDLDGVDAEVLFPTPTLMSGITLTTDLELHLLMVRAYNDWISDFCTYALDRLFGLAILPACGVEAAVAEVERVASLPGVRGVVMGRYPHGGTSLSPDDDPLWAALQTAGLPLTMHVELFDRPPQGTASGVFPGSRNRAAEASSVRLYEFTYSGMMKRFPALEIVIAEVDAGWVPFWKEQARNRWRRQSPALRRAAGMEQSPTTYLDRIFFTYITDSYAIRNRDLVGVRQLMWSNDFPHSESDYPYSWRTIESDFRDVPSEERQLILADNCLRVFNPHKYRSLSQSKPQ